MPPLPVKTPITFPISNRLVNSFNAPHLPEIIIPASQWKVEDTLRYFWDAFRLSLRGYDSGTKNNFVKISTELSGKSSLCFFSLAAGEYPHTCAPFSEATFAI